MNERGIWIGGTSKVCACSWVVKSTNLCLYVMLLHFCSPGRRLKKKDIHRSWMYVGSVSLLEYLLIAQSWLLWIYEKLKTYQNWLFILLLSPWCQESLLVIYFSSGTLVVFFSRVLGHTCQKKIVWNIVITSWSKKKKKEICIKQFLT